MSKLAAFSPPEEVNAFIQAELAETTFDDRYHGAYDDRYIHPFPMEKAEAKARESFSDASAIQSAYVLLYGEELKTHMEKRRHLQSELGVLVKAAQQGSKKEQIFRAIEYRTCALTPDLLQKPWPVDQIKGEGE